MATADQRLRKKVEIPSRALVLGRETPHSLIQQWFELRERQATSLWRGCRGGSFWDVNRHNSRGFGELGGGFVGTFDPSNL